MAKNKNTNPYECDQPEREDAYSTLSPFSYARQPGLQPSPYNQQFMPQQYYVPPMMSSMQMMAPFTHSPAHAVQASQYSDTPTSSQGNAENGAQRKKNRWTDTEEKILIELFGENEDKLRYRSFNSPEWQSIARQLQERCRRENVECEKSAQQCKNKMANARTTRATASLLNASILCVDLEFAANSIRL